jgi:hypothetical protein
MVALIPEHELSGSYRQPVIGVLRRARSDEVRLADNVIDGKIWGGDAELLYYVRSYWTEGDRLTAAVTTSRHTTHNGITSVFGVDKVTIKSHGGVSEDSILAKGRRRKHLASTSLQIFLASATNRSQHDQAISIT